MDTRDYFTYPEEVQRHLRKRTLMELEDLYGHLLLHDEIDEDMDFMEFFDQTLNDMITVENYEGAQVLKDIKKYQGWKLK